MAGYTRQSVADIVNGENITATPLNAEFNTIVGAFSGTSGHSHDGSTGNSPQINLATSVTGYLPTSNGGTGGRVNTTATTDPTTTDSSSAGYVVGSIWINNVSDRTFICVDNTNSSAVWHDLVTINGQNKILPKTSGAVDIGSATFGFNDVYATGKVVSGTFEGVIGATNAQAVTGTTVTATSSFVGDLTGNVTGNIAGTSTGGHVGDIFADDTTSVVLQNGTDGTDAVFTGSVTGNVTGNAAGSHTGSFTGTVDANSVVVSNVATPVASTDGANKQYVLDQLSLGVNSVDQYREDAQKLAINAEDVQYTISTGVTGYSALHYAAKASASQTAAATSETNAGTSETAAANSALIASQKAALVSNSLDAAQGSLIGVLI